MKKRINKRLVWGGVVGLVLLTAPLAVSFRYSYIPDLSQVLNPPPTDAETVKTLQAENADTPVNAELIMFGRKAFYEETFGNEVLFTDIMGVYDGAFSFQGLAKALLKLRGQGTTNLQVAAAKTVTVGGHQINKGDLISTGLDVAKGAYMPLGITVKWSHGTLKAGIGCIACHAIYDPPSGKVIEGTPNPDIHAGMLLALGTNSTAFFTHTDVKRLQDYMHTLTPTVPADDGSRVHLPDASRLEDAVDKALLKWPPGSIDTMIDLENNPVQIPDTYTRGEFPYSWSGIGSVGPFQGLATLSGVPNAQNMDPLAQADASRMFFKLDRELYIGTLLQGAARPRFRYNPASPLRPSEQFARIDPTPGVVGVNELVPTPNAPYPSGVSMVGAIASKPGYPIGYHLTAMAAYQQVLRPPSQPATLSQDDAISSGETVFRKSGCIVCHAGPYYTNNRIVPSEFVGTEPSRSRALQYIEGWLKENQTYASDTPVPLPAKPKLRELTSLLDKNQRTLAMGHEHTGGGYKVPGLLALRYSAPYLHDGGVAVGADERDLGIAATLYRGIPANPAKSLRALIDRDLRALVLEANRAVPQLKEAHITGEGHTYWVDAESGFTQSDQDALIHYLLNLTAPKNNPSPAPAPNPQQPS